MRHFSRAWGDFVVARRWWIIICTLALLALSSAPLSKLYYDNSNESYFLENDITLETFKLFQDYFGDSEYLMVGVVARDQDRDIFTAEAIEVIAELTEFLENHEFITQVRSLSKYQFTHDDDGSLATDDLFEYIEDLRENPKLLDQARHIIADEELALDVLVTQDLKHSRLIARVQNIREDNDHNVKLVSDLMGFIDSQAYDKKGFNLKLSGVPVINERFETLTLKDQRILMPLVAVLIAFTLLLVFRSVFTMIVPLIMILSTTVFVLAAQGFLQFPITTVSSALPMTMTILSMGASIHVLVEFYQARRQGHSPKEAASKSVSDLFYAILFTSLTTSIGFLALSVTDLKPVRHFAWLAAIGPIIIFLISVTFLPSILSFVPWVPSQRKRQSDSPKLQHWLTNTLVQFINRRRTVIGVVGICVSIISLFGAQYIRVDANITHYFKSSNWMNTHLFYFDRQYKGISNLELIVDSGNEGGVKEPEFLDRVKSLQEYIADLEKTGKPTSLIDFLKQINQSMHEDDPDFFVLPESRNLVAQYLLLYENTGPEEDLSDLKDFDERRLRITVPIVNMNESIQSDFLTSVEAKIATEFSDLNIQLTGSTVMNNTQNAYVNKGMFLSFGIAIFVISLCMLFLFASIKHGVIALIPSVMPILLTGSLISLAGITLDLGSMIVGAMAMGIAVDDSIHLMSRYRLVRKSGADIHTAISSALASSGQAVILTSAILIMGFSVFLFGSFVPYIYVGLFSAMIIFIALVADLFFLPALLLIFDQNPSKIKSSNSINEGKIYNA